MLQDNLSVTLEQSIKEFYQWRNITAIDKISVGLINATWKVVADNREYILQKMNTHVFQQPNYIDENYRCIEQYVNQRAPHKIFPYLISGKGGATLYMHPEAVCRVITYIPHTHTICVVSSAEEAFEVSYQFGAFTQLCNGIDVKKIHVVIPHFHDLIYRYQQFKEALSHTSPRIKIAEKEISFLLEKEVIVKKFTHFIQHPSAFMRITHHDTKISNALLNQDNKGVCVIDLDTVMPGYFISDVGDMMRTYLSPVSEEEADFSKIYIRKDILLAIQEGYLSAMQPATLTPFEKEWFLFSGECIIYMQALRFLTDYLKYDIYYGEKYPHHNFVRAQNQITLLNLYQKTIVC